MLVLTLSLLVVAPAEPPRFAAQQFGGRSTGRPGSATQPRLHGGPEVVDGDKTFPIISLRRVNRVLPISPTGPHLITRRAIGSARNSLGGDERSLRFLPSAFPLRPKDAWKVPLSSAAGGLVDRHCRSDSPRDARYSWLANLKNQDVLLFRNGDTDRGTIDGLVPDSERPTISFRSGQGAGKPVAARDSRRCAFNPALARFRKPKSAVRDGPY